MAGSEGYDALMGWLDDAQGRGIIPGLSRMERLLAALGNPERELRCLHVAGTNGKGSVCAFAESVLRHAGLRTGLYTSPHLVRFTERIRINGEEAFEEQIMESLRRLRFVTKHWSEEELPSYFELVTALALDIFARSGVDVVILETGLGGRLDATNVAPKIACAITPIGLDHTEWLGGTLSKIAREKVGILLPGVPAVSSPQDPEALEVLKTVAEEIGSPLDVITEPLKDSIHLGLEGPHQRWNAALALRLVRAAGFSPGPEAVNAGLGLVSWPGRFQRLVLEEAFGGGELILDGAHNVHAARRLAETWKEAFGEKRCRLVFGALADKDPGAVLAELAPLASEILLVPVASPRSEDPRKLAESVKGYSGIIHTLTSLREVFVNREKGEGNPSFPSGCPILLTGSLFLVGEALVILSGGKAALRNQ
jgi:dihydrofolate synthase/folylpolyglutamate synthase